MKKITLLLALNVLFLALIPTEADADLFCEEPNLMALSLEWPGIDLNINGVEPFSTFDAYLFLVNPESNCMAGFELELILPDDLMVLSTTFPGNFINIGSETNFIVGFQFPHQATDNRILLCTLNIMYMNTEGAVQDIYMGPAHPASIEGTMAFLDCSENIVPADPISLDYSLPVARVNGTVPLDYCQDSGEINGLTVQISSQGDDDNLAGTSTWATDGYDSTFDLIDPDPNPVVFFPRPQWNAPEGENFRQDIMEEFDPYATTKSWSFSVNSTFPEGYDPPHMVELDFFPSFAGDENIFMTLVDQATGQYTVLEEPYLHSYPLYFSELRTFELVIGNEPILPPVPDLDVGVDVICNDFADLGNHAAAAEYATDGFDQGIDIPEPGPTPSNYLTAAFTQASWPFGPRFRTMVHGSYSPELAIKTWPLRVETDQIGLVELVFNSSFDEASGISLLIKDQQTNQIYSLFPELTFTYENTTASVRDFLIIVGNQGPPPLSPAVKSIVSGWNLIGMPLVPTPGQTSLADVILDQISGHSYIYHYLGEDGYELEEPMETAVHGRGYWLACNEQFYWTMEGDIALDPVTIPLFPGWNLVGNPLWFTGATENIEVVHLNKTYSWLQAVDEALVVGSVVSFNVYLDEYELVDDLDSWEGYWFGAIEEGVSLVFDWENFMMLPSRISSPDRRGLSPESTWTTDVQVSDAGGNSHRVSFGVHPEASVGFDPSLDVPLMPSGPNDSGHMGLLRPQWEIPMGDKTFRDLVAPDDQSMAWDAEIVVPQAGPVTLRWDRHNWPENLDLQIYLPHSNRVVVHSMRSVNSLRLSAPEGYLVVQFRSPQLSAVDDIPSSVYGLGIHPNPFNPQTTISFGLVDEGRAEIRIYSVRGEMVSRLKSEATGVGRHEVTWSGRDRSGREVPSGSYFARLYVEGKAVGSVAKMSLVR